MYIVASLWKITSSDTAEVDKRAQQTRNLFRNEPGIQMFEAFKCGEKELMAVIGYQDEATYNKIVADENGPFMMALAATGLEHYAQWVQSWRGEAEKD